MSSTVKKLKVATVATVKKLHTASISTAKQTALAAGRQILPKVLNYYKFNATDKKDLLQAYNKYRNALLTTNAKNAYRNAQQAGAQFSNTVFKLLNKASSRPGPVSNGIHNGVQRSVVYWLPGLFVRRTLGWAAKAKTVRRPASA